MNIRSLARLSSTRALSIVLLLAQNFLVIKYLSLEEIGHYYIVTTIAYFGNAIFFVGADLYLQRLLAKASREGSTETPQITRFLTITGVVGGSIVMAFGTAYFTLVEVVRPLAFAALCAALSVATYLSSMGKNILQLDGKSMLSSTGGVVEGAFRVIATMTFVHAGMATASHVAIASILGALCAAAVTLPLSLARHRPSASRGIVKVRAMVATVVPVGCSGVLNWAQLQGYRPALSGIGNVPLIGTVSFMSNLGATAANAVFGVLHQLQVPLQYRSHGATTGRYLMLLGFIASLLAALSVPSGVVFLWATDRSDLQRLVYLVPLGVLIEAGNATISICINHLNVIQRPMWWLPLAPALGTAATFALLFAPRFVQDEYLRVAAGLAAGQLIAVAVVFIGSRLLPRTPAC